MKRILPVLLCVVSGLAPAQPTSAKQPVAQPAAAKRIAAQFVAAKRSVAQPAAAKRLAAQFVAAKRSVAQPTAAKRSAVQFAALKRSVARPAYVDRLAEAEGFAAQHASAARVAVAGQAAHVIRPGDTLSRIAKRHDVRVSDLREWNGLAAGKPLRIDGMLRLTAPDTPLPAWRTRVSTVTAIEANGDPVKECPVPATDLRRIWVRYLGFDGRAHDGNVIMHRTLVGQTQRGFAALYRWRFPIMAMAPAVVPDKTVLTMGYECRYVAGTTKWSQHSYGRAIDINPRQNPMIRGDYLDPPNAATWLARDRYWPGMMHANGAVPAFTTEGFAWGGRWKTLKDYMHFSTTDL